MEYSFDRKIKSFRDKIATVRSLIALTLFYFIMVIYNKINNFQNNDNILFYFKPYE